MITPAYVRTMAAYNAEMNRRLYDAANRSSDEERRRDRGGVLAFDPRHARPHPVGRQPVDEPLRQLAAAGDADQTERPFHRGLGRVVRARARRRDADISRWAAAVDEAWLDEDLVWFSGAAGREISAPKRLLVTHFFNHQTHHRGQAHALITAAGETTEDTDLFLVVPQMVA